MQKGHRVNQARGLISLGCFKDYDDIRNSPDVYKRQVMEKRLTNRVFLANIEL